MMIRVAITDQGRLMSPKDLASPAQLRAAIEQARSLIAECEKLLQPKPAAASAPKQGGMPYLS